MYILDIRGFLAKFYPQKYFTKMFNYQVKMVLFVRINSCLGNCGSGKWGAKIVFASGCFGVGE